MYSSVKILVGMPPKKRYAGQAETVVNLEDGALYEQRRLEPNVRKPHKQSNFGFIYMTEMQSVLTDERLSNFDTRLLMLMATKVEFDNVVYQTQIELAAALHVRSSQVSRSLKNLTGMGYVSCVRQGKYLLDADCLWKGSPEVRDTCMEMGLEQRTANMQKAAI